MKIFSPREDQWETPASSVNYGGKQGCKTQIVT